MESIRVFIERIRERGALGIVVALSFQGDAKEMLKGEGVHPVSKDDIRNDVMLWDPLKQKSAFNAFEWAVVQKERSSGLIERYRKFINEITALQVP